MITYTFCRYRKGYYPGVRAFGLGALPFVASEAFTFIWKLGFRDSYPSLRRVSSFLAGVGTAGILAKIWKDVYQT